MKEGEKCGIEWREERKRKKFDQSKERNVERDEKEQAEESIYRGRHKETMSDGRREERERKRDRWGWWFYGN